MNRFIRSVVQMAFGLGLGVSALAGGSAQAAVVVDQSSLVVPDALTGGPVYVSFTAFTPPTGDQIRTGYMQSITAGVQGYLDRLDFQLNQQPFGALAEGLVTMKLFDGDVSAGAATLISSYSFDAALLPKTALPGVDNLVTFDVRDANFFGFFVGIESPDPETLVQTAKKQNIKHEIYESVHKIYAHGMILFPGFIVGFDSEKQGVADGIIQCVEDAALPMGMLGLLYALPGTQLTRRLTKEGRLHPETGHDLDSRQGDFALSGLNFDTLRPRADILRDFAGVLRRLYEPKAYFGRLRRAVLPMQRVKLPAWIAIRDSLREIDRFFRIMWEVTLHRPDMRWPVWKLIVECLIRNPNAVRNIMVMVVFYLYLAPLSRFWIGETERQIEAIESGRWQPPLATRTPALAPV